MKIELRRRQTMMFRWDHLTGHIEQQDLGGTRSRLSIETWPDERFAAQALDSGLLELDKAWHPWTDAVSNDLSEASST